MVFLISMALGLTHHGGEGYVTLFVLCLASRMYCNSDGDVMLRVWLALCSLLVSVSCQPWQPADTDISESGRSKVTLNMCDGNWHGWYFKTSDLWPLACFYRRRIWRDLSSCHFSCIYESCHLSQQQPSVYHWASTIYEFLLPAITVIGWMSLNSQRVLAII